MTAGPAKGFDLGPRRRGRRMSLTPMIDVVFLLLIFFMLAARFGHDLALPIDGAAMGAGTDWQGPPRLLDITPDALALNGALLPPEDLQVALQALMPEDGGAVVLRPRGGADLQRLVDVMAMLRHLGFDRLILVE